MWRCGIHYALTERAGLVGSIEDNLSLSAQVLFYTAATGFGSLITDGEPRPKGTMHALHAPPAHFARCVDTSKAAKTCSEKHCCS